MNNHRAGWAIVLLRPAWPWALGLWLFYCFAAPAQVKAATKDLSEQLFAEGRICRIEIEMAPANLTSLRSDPRTYVSAMIKADGQTYPDVAIRLKGGAGSFRGVDEKPSLTVNMDKFVAGQRFHGLDKFHLNNSIQDPTYMTELICGELFLAANVPAARTAHARVSLNGRDLGLYVLKEGFDKTFLKRHFKSSKGNLYDGGFLRDITDPLEKDSGEGPDDFSDLKALAAAAQGSTVISNRRCSFRRARGRLFHLQSHSSRPGSWPKGHAGQSDATNNALRKAPKPTQENSCQAIVNGDKCRLSSAIG